jgi:hypothetical protein
MKWLNIVAACQAFALKRNPNGEMLRLILDTESLKIFMARQHHQTNYKSPRRGKISTGQSMITTRLTIGYVALASQESPGDEVL